jgi:hypothetical protein
MTTKIFQAKNKNMQNGSQVISRHDFLKQIAFSAGFLITSCTPVKILLNTHENKFDNDTDLKQKVLSAFVGAVIPGSDNCDPNSLKIFCDEYYPFHKYCGFFISDLCAKSKNLFGTENFYDLSLQEQTELIQAGLDDDAVTSRIYSAAIFISQVSVYCSIYDDKKGCELIDFPGSYAFVDAEMHYQNSQLYLAAELTSTGNYS